MDNIIENISEAELAEMMRTSCRLCLSQSQSRVNLLTKEMPGLTLMEMVQSLTGVQINEHDGSKSLMVCVSCAGKVVNFHEFRQLCQDSEKKFNQMEMALHLKRRQSLSHVSQFIDDDMEILFVCKICKETFDDQNLLKEHRKQHGMNGELQMVAAQSTPVVVVKDERKTKRQKISQPVAGPSTSYVANLYPCRQCTQTFRTYMSRLNHETLSHAKTDVANEKNETFPVTKKSSKRLRGHRRSPIVKSTKKEAKPAGTPKYYACETCNMTFPNHKAKYWHIIKTHKLKIGGKPKERKTFSCRHCNKTFDKSYSKYNHERVCPWKGEPEQSESSVIIEQPLLVAPVVEITEDDGSINESGPATEGKFKCTRCPAEFTSLRGLSLHEKKEHNLLVNECRKCGRIFASYATRYQHQKNCNKAEGSENELNEDEVAIEQEDEEEEIDAPMNGQSRFQEAFTQSL